MSDRHADDSGDDDVADADSRVDADRTAETDSRADADSRADDRSPRDPFEDALAADDAPSAGDEADDSTADAFREPLDAPTEPADDDLEDAFEAVDIEEIDTESVWDELLGSEADAEAFDADPTGESTASASVTAGPSAAVATDETADAGAEGFDSDAGSYDAGEHPPQDIGSDGDVALVDKRAYCQQCPHFSQPPAVRCDREGTTIAEVLEDGRFRLHNCPVVTEDGPDRSYFTGHDS